MNIKPKMFLNASPQTAEQGSLVYANNIKIDDDGNIVTDYGYDSILLEKDTSDYIISYEVLGHIVGLNNIVYFLCIKHLENKFYPESNANFVILEYNEISKESKELDTEWSPGSSNSRTSTFSGAVTTNISGEPILTIAEVPSNENERVPLKHINLSYAEVADQSLYCQAPKIPLLNLLFNTTYSKTIPNGTYIFFVRYKIREGVFTKWYLASRPCFAGTSDRADTLQGGVEYINIHRDSANSFVFDVEAIYGNYARYYKGFQVGFIITHDEGTDARIWKYFDFSYVTGTNTVNNKIYFDYEDIQETNIDDLLEPTYEIYNVKNVTVFKNQLYISNYIESKNDVRFEENNHIGYTVVAQPNTNKPISGENRSFNYLVTYNGYSTNYQFNKLIKDIYVTNTTTLGQTYWKSVKNGSLTISLTDIVKENTRTTEDVYNLTVGYDLDRFDPDIAVVYGIKNRLVDTNGNAVIFGNDYPGDPGCVFTSWEWREDGIDAQGSKLYRISSNYLNTSHNLWRKGNKTKPGEGYACIKLTDSEQIAHSIGVTTSEWTAYPITDDSQVNSSFIARNGGFNKECRTLIINHLSSYIKEQEQNKIMCIELYSGTSVFRVDSASNTRNIESLDGAFYVPGNGDQGIASFSSITERGLTDTDITNLTNYINTITNSNHLIGLSYSGELIFDIGKWYNANNQSKYIKINTIKIKLRKYEFETDKVDLEDSDSRWYAKIVANCKITDYAVVCNIGLANPITYNNNANSLSQSSSLMPYSKYEVYLHDVDEHGIISDGTKISTLNITSDIAAGYNSINLQLTIDNDTSVQNPIRVKHTAFMSIINVGNIVARCFDYNKIGNDHYVSCIELDALLLNETNNLKIKIVGVNSYKTVEYLSSGNVKPSIAFGNCGLLHWTEAGVDYSNNIIYVIIERNVSNDINKRLIKASPYFTMDVGPSDQDTIYFYGDNSSGIKDCFYGSYVCNVRKPSFDLSSTCYAVGNEVYAADRTAGIKLTDFEGLIQQSFGSIHTIVSPFNLNYLSLTQDLKDTIFKVGSATSGVKQVVKILDSATLSYIYELKSMYKDFMNVYFRPLQDYYKTSFDNTVRVSNVLSDETFNNDIYRFSPTDYYNIPTNRGVIVKLFSIGSSIYAHTKLSLYKFDGNQMLVGNNTDIQLKESEPFDAGITQLFDSEYGYGGIAEKSASCITFDSYFFYDSDSNHIFAYKDNQPVLIDNSIKLFLDYIVVVANHCNVIPDVNNNRVFFNFTHTSGLNVTLSYNYKTKTFVSFHDLSLVGSFNTKTNVYHYKLNRKDVTIRGTDISIFCTDFGRLFNTTTYGATPSNFYGLATKKGSGFGKLSDSNYVIAVVMYPSSNITEVINYVKYIGSDVKNSYSAIDVLGTRTVIVDFGESSGSEIKPPYNPVEKSYIITDRCKSNIVQNDVNDTDDTAVERQVSSTLENIKGFKFDKGSWNFNYFRNELNSEDDFKYYNANGYGPEPNGYKQVGNVQARALKSDYNSLVYGRYFIIVLALKDTKQVKMEEIFISTEKY